MGHMNIPSISECFLLHLLGNVQEQPWETLIIGRGFGQQSLTNICKQQKLAWVAIDTTGPGEGIFAIRIYGKPFSNKIPVCQGSARDASEKSMPTIAEWLGCSNEKGTCEKRSQCCRKSLTSIRRRSLCRKPATVSLLSHARTFCGRFTLKEGCPAIIKISQKCWFHKVNSKFQITLKTSEMM